jgi:hypothetical protein
MSWSQKWSRVDASLKVVLALVAFGGIVAGAAKAAESYVSRHELMSAVEKQAATDRGQEDDINLLFQTQVRLVTSVEGLQREVHEVRKDLRALDAGRPLPPLRREAKLEGDAP